MTQTSPEPLPADWPVWSHVDDPAELGRYIVPTAVAQHARVPAPSGEAPLARLRQIWQVLKDKHIGYAHERPSTGGGQWVRPPAELLVAPGSGTCLDLAILLAGACEYAGLPAAVLLLDPVDGRAAHALVGVGVNVDPDAAWRVLTGAPPGQLVDRVRTELSGPPRDIVVLDPNGLAHSLGYTATGGLDTDLATSVAAGYRYLTDPSWQWRLTAPPGPARLRYRPAPAPVVPPLRGIYRDPSTVDSPLRLVRSEYALTPFQSRDELTVLTELCQSTVDGKQTCLVVIHGAGGSGKTRLGLELADRMRRTGWHAGVLREAPSTMDWLATVTAPLLVLVDYADARVAELTSLLSLVSKRSGPPAVVVATARAIDGDWLAQVSDALIADQNPVRQEVIRLADAHPRAGQIYRLTYQKVAGTTTGPPPLPATRDQPQWTTLDLVLHGWLAAQPDSQRPTTRSSLYQEVMRHEQKYWARAFTDITGQPRPDREVLAQAGALLTLRAPLGAEVNGVLRLVDQLANADEWRGTVARTMITCLDVAPGERLSIRPDPVGEHHLTTVLAANPDLLTAWLPVDVDPDTQLRALVALNRAGTAALIERVLRDQPGRWLDVLVVATALHGPAETALANLVAEEACPLPLDELSERMPVRSAGLWRLARQVDERRLADADPHDEPRRIALLRQLGLRRAAAGDAAGALDAAIEALTVFLRWADADPAHLPELARTLFDLSLCQSRFGDRRAALGSSTEAVAIYRGLADTDPGFLPDLGMSLHNLSLDQSDSGDAAAALASITEAVSIRRAAAGTGPAAAADLAESLDILGAQQRQAGDRAAALAAVTEAWTIQRSLIEASFEIRRDQFAGLLINMSLTLSSMGDRVGAVASSTQAVAIYRQLTQANPAVFLRDLAMSLNHLSNHLSDTGDVAAAMAAITEATAVYRRLAETDAAPHLPALTKSLTNLANRQWAAGDPAGGLGTITEAVAIARRLVAANPRPHLPDLALALNTLSVCQDATGDRAAALATVTETVAIYRRLAGASPAVHLPNLAGALTNLSIWQNRVADWAGSLATVTEAVAIYRRLTDTDPMHLPQLASALNTLSLCQSRTGDAAGALATSTTAVTICRRLAELDPVHLPRMAMSLATLSECQGRTGDRAAALSTMSEAVGIQRRLARGNPEAALPGLAGSLTNLANLQHYAGDLVGALATATEAVAILRRPAPADRAERSVAASNLAAGSVPAGSVPAGSVPAGSLATGSVAASTGDSDPSDLASALNILSAIQRDAGQALPALTSSTEAVALCRRLAAADPDAFRPELANSLGTLATCQAGTGDAASAVVTGTEAVALYRRLAAANADAFRPELATSLAVVSTCQIAAGDLAAALVTSTEAVTINRRLAEANPAAYLPAVAALLAIVSSCQAGTGDVASALVTGTEAVDISRRLAEADPDAFLPGLASALGALGNASVDAANAAWASAIGALDGARRGELRAHYAAWLLYQRRPAEATAQLIVAAGDVSGYRDPVALFALARARHTVRDVVQRLDTPSPRLPAWATAAIPADHLAFVNDWLAAARDWPTEQSAARDHAGILADPTLAATLATMRFLQPDGATDLGRLRALVDAVAAQGLEETLAVAGERQLGRSLRETWLGLATVDDIFAFLAAHHERLRAPEVRRHLRNFGGEAGTARAAVLDLADRWPLDDVRDIVADPDTAAQKALDAMETGALDVLDAIIAACPAVLSITGTGRLLLAVWRLNTGNRDDALILAAQAVAECTDIQRRAYQIRLRKLAAVNPLDGLAELIGLC
jgi:hypothetical protein